ncbi:MAG TPA: MFS transporter [Sphingomonas sp.]|jgi:Na+/melibiose symporter-like transporter|nr:MFS transporter [Sphingomonas sp.]
MVPARARLLTFTSPAIPLAAIGLPFVVHLPPYYVGELGLGLGTVGLIFFLVRAIDLPLDPLLGHLIDRTRTRFGRFRPWFVGGALMMMVASYLVFMAKPGISAAATFAALMLLYAGMSSFMLSHLSWATTLSEDYDQRSRVFGWIQAMAVFGMVLVLMLPPLAGALGGSGSPAAGVHAMGWFVIASLPISLALVLATTHERPRAAATLEPGLRDMLKLFRNRLMMRLLAADLLAGIAPGITGSMFIFYFEHRLGFDASTASLLLLVYFVAGLLAAPLWMKLALRIGKHKAATVAALTFCVTNSAIILLPTHNLTSAIAGMAFAGLPYAAFPFLMRAMLADVIDTDRLDTGLDRAGLFSAVLTTTTKIAHALPIGVIYPILGLIGFNGKAGAANTPDAIMGLTILFIGAPVVVMLGAAWAVARWPHDARAHQAVIAALADRKPRVAQG